MNKRPPLQRRQRDRELDQALAALISSTRSKKRPLPLTEVGKWLEVATTKLGGYQALAERVGISAKMLRQFSYVGRLSEEARALFEKRKLDSVDAAGHLAMLSHDEQNAVARELAKGSIDTTDVRAITQLGRIRKSAPIAEVLERVKNSKTRREYVAEFVVRGGRDHRTLLNVFRKHISSPEIIRLEIDGAFGRLVLTPTGKRRLFEAAKSLGCPMKNVIQRVLSSS